MSEIHESEERKATAASPRDGKGSKGGKTDDILKNTGEVRQACVHQKNLRLGSSSNLSNHGASGDSYNVQIKDSFRLKRGTKVPDSFLVPMVLRKTKNRQKQSLSPGSNNLVDIHSSSIAFTDLTL